MALQIVYFAWVRERIGLAEERVELPDGVGDVAALVAWLAGGSEGHRAALSDVARLRAAIDGRFVPMDAAVGDAREVAIFPPVTGG